MDIVILPYVSSVGGTQRVDQNNMSRANTSSEMKEYQDQERADMLKEDIKDIIHDLRNAELDLKEALRWRDNRKERLASLRNQLKALKE